MNPSPIRRILAAVALAGGLLLVATAPAFSDDHPGCHGQNQEDCRDDPNPHGQDCDEHGQHNESNDDHCGTTTTTGLTDITLPELPSNPTTSTTEKPFVLPPQLGMPTSSTTATTAPAVVTPPTSPPAARPAPPADVLGLNRTRPQLPFTGSTAVPLLVAVALVLLISGALLLVAGRRRPVQ